MEVGALIARQINVFWVPSFRQDSHYKHKRLGYLHAGGKQPPLQ